MATDAASADRLLAELVARHLGQRLAIGRRCTRCGSGGHGRPVVDGGVAHLSLSRAPGLVLAAVSTAGPVGVDVEQAGSAGFSGFEEVAVHPEEECRDATVTWVRKEAMVKATGWGLAIDLRRVRLDETPRLVAWEDHLPRPARCWIEDLPLSQGFVGAVAGIRPSEAPADRARRASQRAALGRPVPRARPPGR